jgi:hypothetical protein
LAENEKIDTIGVDAHAVDGRLFLVSFRCVSG